MSTKKNTTLSIKYQHNNDGTVLKILDLHGFRKEQAISRVTSFFSEIRNEHKMDANRIYMVQIITGSGKHSPNGPVLREAVRKTLEKRQMEFTMTPGNSSYIVNALSGHVLYSPDTQHQDSKVIIAPPLNRCDVNLVDRKLNSPSESKDIVNADSFETSPLPHEVADDDKLVRRIKRVSTKEVTRLNSIKNKELKAVNEAISESLVLEKESEKEHEQFQEILKTSQEDYESNVRLQDVQEDEDIQRILKESQEDHEIHLDRQNRNEEAFEMLIEKIKRESVELTPVDNLETQDLGFVNLVLSQSLSIKDLKKKETCLQDVVAQSQ